METKQSRDLGDTPGANFDGSWKIREQRWSWNTTEQEMARRNQLDRIHNRMCHYSQQSTKKLMSVYFFPSCRKMFRTIEKHINSKKNIQIIGRDFNDELGPGTDVERVSVGPQTLKESNKRGDWLKQWLMMQNLVAVNTMYRKTPENQNTYRTAKGTEKQLDYILIERRHLGCSKDAEANDMIHMVATTEVSWQQS